MTGIIRIDENTVRTISSVEYEKGRIFNFKITNMAEETKEETPITEETADEEAVK